MRYTVQRPTEVWVEVVVEADNLDKALELADKEFENGDYETMEMTFGVNFDHAWIQAPDGKTYNQNGAEI
jgi:hypothetical protein